MNTLVQLPAIVKHQEPHELNEIHDKPKRADIKGVIVASQSRSRTARLTLITAGIVLGLVIVISTFYPGAPIFPSGLTIGLFLYSFPLSGWAIFEHRSKRKRNLPNEATNADYNQIWTDIGYIIKKYRNILFVAVPTIGGLWIMMMISIVTLQGSPMHVGNQHYLDDHGSHIPVSQSGYENALAAQDRGFAAGATLSLCVAGPLTMFKRTFGPQPEPNDI